MIDKEIIIDGVDVNECEFCESDIVDNDVELICKICKYRGDFIYGCKNNPNCLYKQLQREKEENLNNKQMVESAENLINENAYLLGELERKTEECKEWKNKYYQSTTEVKADLIEQLSLIKYDRDWIKQKCIEAGKELAKYSFDWDGKEKNLVVQVMHLNELYEKKIAQCNEQKARIETLRVDNNRLIGEVCDIRTYAGSLQHKLQIATEALKLILTVQKECKKCPHQEFDVDVLVCDLDCATAFKKIASKALEQIESEINNEN